MLKTTSHVRPLTTSDLDELLALLDRDPLVNLFVRNRVDATELQTRWLGGQIWGCFEDGELVSACHAGANVVPVQATPAAVEAFAERALSDNVRPSSIVGPRDAVAADVGAARAALGAGPVAAPGPAVHGARARPRPARPTRAYALWRSTSRHGLSGLRRDVHRGGRRHPEIGDRSGYRARVAQLISQGWAFARHRGR